MRTRTPPAQAGNAPWRQPIDVEETGVAVGAAASGGAVHDDRSVCSPNQVAPLSPFQASQQLPVEDRIARVMLPPAPPAPPAAVATLTVADEVEGPATALIDGLEAVRAEAVTDPYPPAPAATASAAVRVVWSACWAATSFAAPTPGWLDSLALPFPLDLNMVVRATRTSSAETSRLTTVTTIESPASDWSRRSSSMAAPVPSPRPGAASRLGPASPDHGSAGTGVPGIRQAAGYPGPVADRDVRVRVPRRGLALPDPRTESAGPDEFDRLASLAQVAEAAGFDSVWVADGPPPPGRSRDGGESVFEPYSLLGALAVRTRRVALAVLPDGPTGRPPSMVAKIVTGIDVIAHGRAVLALGAGPPTDPESPARLAEELQICRALLVEDAPTFIGAHHRIVDAPNRPRPVHPAGPPMVVASDRLDVLDPVARYADALVVTGDAGAVRRAVQAVERHCESVGRDPEGVVVLWHGPAGRSRGPDGDHEADRLGSLADAGAAGFVLDPGPGARPEDVTRIAALLDAVATRAFP